MLLEVAGKTVFKWFGLSGAGEWIPDDFLDKVRFGVLQWLVPGILALRAGSISIAKIV
jgi:hypothetical protein